MRMLCGTILAAAVAVTCAMRAESVAGGIRVADGGPKWRMFDRRVGMFVHWGVYSVGGVHEQEWMRAGMTKEEYEKYPLRFTGEKFDPDAWIDAAESFGAEYIVFTAKHHDGFCMWDTALTDWKSTNTPFGRDAVGELAAACRRRGMHLGLYYSNPDWHHPNAYNPLSTHQLSAPNPGDSPDIAKYREYVKAQVTELLTRYGDICCLFWDIPPHVEDASMNELVRRLQPGIMVNNRGWSADGDYSTPERGHGDQGSSPARFCEVCDSLDADSWGYNRNARWHTPEYLRTARDNALSKGWNFLLNVGPKPDGTIPDEALAILKKLSKPAGCVLDHAATDVADPAATAARIAVVGFDDLPAAKPTLFSMSFKATECLKDYGSLAYVAAADSSAADKRKADLVCDGSADAAAINAVVAQMAAGRGGKIVFFPGTYVVDSWTERPWPEKRGGGKQFFGIAVPYTQAQIDFEGIGFTHKDKNTSLEMNGRGVVFKPSDRLWSAMEKGGRYSLVGGVADSNPNSSGRGYSWGFFTLKNISFRLPDNDKAITVVDGIWTSEMACDGVQIATGAPFNDDSRVNPRCIGIRTCAAGNNNRRYTIDHCKLMGLGTGFHVAGEHLIMRQCIAQRCAYGYVFGNVPFLESWSQQVSNHPLTMVNCSFEYTWYGITFGKSGNGNPDYVCTFNAIDLNAEESEGYDAYKAWKERKLVQDMSDGYWMGEIAYHLTSKANGHIPSRFNLWGGDLSEGRNFRTVNLAARRRGPTSGRPTSMTDLGFGYFDTDLNRMVWRTESGWSE